MASLKVSSARLVILAILGKQRVCREIQNLCMRFVILKVRNPIHGSTLKGTPLRYSVFAWIMGFKNLAYEPWKGC